MPTPAASFGVLPGGRGNDFARVLGIPSEIDDAVAVLAAGHVREIDVGEVNDKRFLCIASCGFDSDANRIANEAKRIKGQAVYLYAALRAVWEWKPARFTLTFDGDESEVFTGYSVAAANSRAYGGGMFIAPDAILDDGLLDVVWTGDISKRRFLSNLPKVFKGTHVSERRGGDKTGGLACVSRPTAPSPSTPTATTWPIFRPPCACCARRCA